MLEFIQSVFGGFDKALINAFLGLENSAGGFYTPLFKFITLIGEKGLIFFGLAIVLMLFSRTRKLGICIFGAVACGALITNFILKDLIARPRPCHSDFISEYLSLGYPSEDGYSFPSGHVTAIASASFAFFLGFNKKISWLGFPFVILMGISRIYLLAHYPSDVIAGILVGAISGVIAFYITKLIYSLLNKYKDNKLCDFVLNKGLVLNKKGAAEQVENAQSEQ